MARDDLARLLHLSFHGDGQHTSLGPAALVPAVQLIPEVSGGSVHDRRGSTGSWLRQRIRFRERCKMMVSAVGITSDVLVGGSDAATPSRISRGPRPLSCLVVTGNDSFRERLQSVADIAEWTACVAPVQADELEAASIAEHRLVLIDIAEPCGDRMNDTVRLAEDFVRRPGTLVVVCGSGESVDEELWARQLGVWLYLPGVSAGDALVEVFVEARRLSGVPNRIRQFV